MESITKPGAEIHDYQPTPLDIVKAQAADLVLWNGLNLERWFEKFFDNVKDVPSVVVSEGVEPMGIAEGPYTGKPNPHAWMSPNNALIYVENIRKALVKHDPANADTYNRERRRLRRARSRRIDEPLRKTSGGDPGEPALAGRRAKAPSAISPATIGMRRPISGRSTPTSRARRSRCARSSTCVRKNKIPVVFSESTISDRRGQAGRTRNRRPLRRRALRRLAQRRRTARCRPISTCCR